MFDGERSISFCGMCTSVGRASGMKKKKKNVIHIGCLVETNVAWSRFECDVKRQITINTRCTRCLYVHTYTHIGLSFEYVLFSRRE